MNDPTTTTTSDPLVPSFIPDEEWLELQLYNGYRVWHIIFFIMTVFFTLVVFMCCCVRFRIPRTKQEIEADFVRRKIATKFCKQLRLLSDTEMDNMDLLKALKRLQSELEIPSNETVEESDEVLSSTKTASPSLKKSSKSSDFDSSVEKLDEEPENVLSGRLATLVNVLNVMKPRRKHIADDITPNLITV
ncbi:transmembrane inner ear expressed protein [Acyrthosiphon pisum]|uniref:Transmembrane inner ear expressed protein n=1 Tax=Acyrthosiphon pisum TaxID=7029 RepID=A0A8R2D3L7_ACYPI|nr:transmembrane inner ear expressed protein [Acyrthosiphon pisum]|eukprot:XP_016659196.1 PREDICTED: transmembrane inner ear expressed protein [Acyrthosiphon pisum]